jgi:hypothetical protein
MKSCKTIFKPYKLKAAEKTHALKTIWEVFQCSVNLNQHFWINTINNNKEKVTDLNTHKLNKQFKERRKKIINAKHSESF